MLLKRDLDFKMKCVTCGNETDVANCNQCMGYTMRNNYDIGYKHGCIQTLKDLIKLNESRMKIEDNDTYTMNSVLGEMHLLLNKIENEL